MMTVRTSKTLALHVAHLGGRFLWVWQSAVGVKRAREALPSIDPNHAKTLAHQAVVVEIVVCTQPVLVYDGKSQKVYLQICASDLLSTLGKYAP